MPPILYQHCRCPKCHCPLDEVEEHTEFCPGCGGALEAAQVWETRRYPGIMVLPPWIRAFGWPVVLVAAGITFFLAAYSYGEISIYIPGFLISLGVILFFAKLSGAKSRY